MTRVKKDVRNDFNHGIDCGLTEVICMILGQNIQLHFSNIYIVVKYVVTKISNRKQQSRLIHNSYTGATVPTQSSTPYGVTNA